MALDVSDDSFLQSHSVNCRPFVRSLPAPISCKLGYREQTNILTHFLDASNVYGSSQQEVDAVRNFSGGYLNYRSTGEDGEICDNNTAASSNKYCYLPNYGITAANVFQIYAGKFSILSKLI